MKRDCCGCGGAGSSKAFSQLCEKLHLLGLSSDPPNILLSTAGFWKTLFFLEVQYSFSFPVIPNPAILKDHLFLPCGSSQKDI